MGVESNIESQWKLDGTAPGALNRTVEKNFFFFFFKLQGLGLLAAVAVSSFISLLLAS